MLQEHQNLANIPLDLQAIPTWVCWKSLVKPGRTKPIKMPVNPNNGGPAKSSDPTTWSDFKTAADRFRNDPTLAGVGFVFTKGCGVVGVDLDNVVDDQGNLSADVEALLTEFDSYTELSVSRKGLHILCKATPPPEITSLKRPNTLSFACEIFASGFFLVISGDRCLNLPATIEPRQQALDNLLEALEVTPTAKARKKKAVTSEDAPEGLRSLDDFENSVLVKVAALNPRERKDHRSPTGMDGWKWTVDCPWASSHTNGDPEASVFLHEDGKPGFRCLHSHCHDKNWKDFQKLYDLPACGIVAEYNEKHALVNIEGKVRIMSEVVRPGEDFLEEQYQTKDDFMLFHSNDKDKVTYADGTTSWVAKAAVWLASPKRRQYSHIVFEPNGRPAKDVYNLFRGWNVSPSPGDWSLFNKHLLEIICDGNAEHHRWLLSWFARIIQDPGGAKPGTCPVLCGGQGTGKTTVGDVFGRLIRPHYIPLTKPEQLVGKFNQHLKGKLFICADEAFFAGARGDVGRLKSLITDRTITVEPKGIDAYATTNHINLMMCSNNSWVVPAEMDERRFFVLNVNPARAKDHRYFGAIHDQMEAGGYEGLFYDMLRWDYKQVNLREAPKTVGLAEQKLASLTPVASYWNDALLNGKIIRANDDLDRLEGEEDGGDWPESVLKTNVYNGYRTWAKKVGHKYQEHSSVFWRETTKLFGPFKERREGAQHNNKFVHIPPYAELVATWESKIGKLS